MSDPAESRGRAKGEQHDSDVVVQGGDGSPYGRWVLRDDHLRAGQREARDPVPLPHGDDPLHGGHALPMRMIATTRP
jgi:hypothetical protein